ncbi:MAG: FAD-binding oxidoreductase [Acidimicrobiales bacterium]
MTRLSRRELLAGAGAVGLSVGAALLGGCAPDAPGHKRAIHHATKGPPPWGQLAARLKGSLITRGVPRHGIAKELFDPLFDSIDPSAIAMCADTSDVQRCVDFARHNKVSVAARAGGHSYAGYSTVPDGLVIDVSAINDVTTSGTSASVGAGARLIDIYQALGSAGVLLPGGSCPTVGIAGLTLGGGIGVFDRLYGLTCDNLGSLRMIAADASIVDVSQSTHSDLFWASKGGGGGNFGIVTKLHFTIHPIPQQLAIFTLDWPFDTSEDVLGAELDQVGTQRAVVQLPARLGGQPRPQGDRRLCRWHSGPRDLGRPAGHRRRSATIEQVHSGQGLSRHDVHRGWMRRAECGGLSPTEPELGGDARKIHLLCQVDLRVRTAHF